MSIIKLTPVDTICACDARPKMAGDSFGSGAKIPLGPTTHGALRSALLKDIGIVGKHCSWTRKGKTRNIGSPAFNWLGVRGPLPIIHLHGKDVCLFPTPADLYVKKANNHSNLNEIKCSQMTWTRLDSVGHPNPEFAAKTFGSTSKNRPPEWIDEAGMSAYVSGSNEITLSKYQLFKEEYRTGVGLDNMGLAEDSKLFGSTHARFLDNVSLIAEITGRKRAKQWEIEKFDSLTQVLLGGEGRLANLTHASGKIPIPAAPDCSEGFVKWVLLTPAIFFKGAIPDFVDGAGKVMLKGVEGELVGYCLSRPVTISLYDTIMNRPNQVATAVGAGSVFLFRADDATNLVAALHNSTRSSVLGEKGMGWGICAAPTTIKTHL